MFTSSPSSITKLACALYETPKICELLLLPSTPTPMPTFTLPAVYSDVQHSPRNFNTVTLPKFSSSPLPISANTGQLPWPTRSTSLLSPTSNTPEMWRSVHILCRYKNEISICYSHKKLCFTPKTSGTTLSPLLIHHQLQLSSPNRNIPLLELPPSVFDVACLPYNTHTLQTPHTWDTALSLPTTSTHVKHVLHLVPPSLLQSCLNYVYAPQGRKNWRIGLTRIINPMN